ncbi:SdrD B-like domain-containing protein [Arthrobacter sp. UM1]|uniref:SdrD B-like domain-containing protein n=1 Tax=Arthrobacter sp. UM1 TaxID=2766776 RepID=UPI001CF68F84|nr:SdrD B-like domain-containing protein [Arthrobacter sp. UM1]MCB4209219.1 hypothetical protein [Arthrobacter sp. UM1]
MVSTPLSTSLRRLRIFMAALFAAVVAVGSAGLFAPAASAAAPTVTVSLQRTFTGTGQGTSDQCVVNAAHGFTPGDETAADDYVCSNDSVGYRMDLAIKSDANPSPVTLVFKVGPGFDTPFRDSSFTGADDFCVSRPGQWTVSGSGYVQMVQVGAKYYPSCTITPAPNANISYRQDLTVTAGDDSPNVADAQIIKADSAGAQTSAATAAGYTVLRSATLDLRLRQLTGGQPVNYNGKYYLVQYLEISGDALAVPGTSASKGGAVFSDAAVKIDLSGAPPGTIVTDVNGNETTLIPFFNSIRGQNQNQPGEPARIGTLAKLLIPIPTSSDTLDVNVTARVAQDSPVIKAVTGESNMNGGTQIGQQLADCTQSTDPLGGLTPLGGLANNDCSRTRVYYNVPGDMVSKNVNKVISHNIYGAFITATNASGQKKTFNPAFNGGDTATSVIRLSPLPGSFPVDMCDVWDPQDQSLQTNESVTVGPSDGSASFDPSTYDVYYSHQSGAGLSCGDQSTLDGWSTDPSQVQGGVNAIRIRSKAPVEASKGITFTVPLTPNVDRTDFDEYGMTPPLWDRAYVTTGRSTGWGTGNSAFSYATKYSLESHVVGSNGISVQPGETAAFQFMAYANAAGALSEATPRITATLSPCAAPEGAPAVGDLWTASITPGKPAGGPGCEDDEPAVVTITAKRPLSVKELASFSSFSIPVRMSALAVTTSQVASAHMDFVDQGLRFVPSDATSTMVIARQAAVLAAKTVDKASMQRDEQLTWTMGLSNTLSIPVTGAQWIDVLPYNGDANGTATAGRVVLDSSTVPSGATAEYSKTAPASVSNNPADASNQAGGGTVWCDSYTAGGDCPSSLSEVTAVRYTMDLASGASQYLQLKAHVDGGKNGDTVSNRLGVGTSPDLAQPVPSPDKVTTALFDSSLAGTVWWDEDKDGARGASEPGIPGVKVEAVSDSGDVLSTTTTDAAGHYGFPGLLAGTYRTRVVADQDVLKDAEQTYSYKDATGGNASLTSTPFALGRNATLGDVDFGFFRPAAPTPTPSPTDSPTATPSPTDSPTASPSPTDAPTGSPTGSPSPTDSPTATPSPTDSPTKAPTASPTSSPTGSPSAPATSPAPGKSPSSSPSSSTGTVPSVEPTSGTSNQGGPHQGSNPGGVNTPGSLAYTGVRVGGLLLGAAVLIAAGVLVARRRREEREQR